MAPRITQEAVMAVITRTERRKGPDPYVKVISYFSGATWLLVMVILAIVSSAQPKTPTLFDRNARMMGSGTWDKSLLVYAIIALAVTAIICFTGLAINSIRHRRKSDIYNRSLMVFGVGSIIGIIVYFIFA